MKRWRFEGMEELKKKKKIVNGKGNEKRKRMVKFLGMFDEGKMEI